LLRSLSEARERRQELESHSRALWRCLAEKNRLAREVCTGSLSLLEAAACFRDLQNAVPNYPWNEFRAIRPGRTDEEKLCLSVIDLVAVLAEESSSGGEAMLDRLKADLQLHLERGTLRLRPARPLAAASRYPEPRIVQ
jgi:hypothetical protein